MRHSARGEQSAFSLFPFLAVLLCTMGAMVVLLVAMAHVSRQKAAREAEAAAAAAEAARLAADTPERRELEAALERAEQENERVRALLAQGEDRLADEQSRLSGVEDHLRRLREEAEELTAEVEQLVLVEESYLDDQALAEGELERLNKLIGEITDEIDELKHRAVGRERKYAVTTLRDRSTGTARPAIYFECTAEGLVMQPEGVRFEPEDLVAAEFSSPIAAASRAVDRFYEQHPETRAANEAGRPYPLLLVRPGGVVTYYRARASLTTAGVDFGYQPVGEDWDLEYDAPNPVLSQWVQDAVDTARASRENLAELVPRLRAEIEGVHRGGYGGGYAGGQTAASLTPGSGVRVFRSKPNPNNPFEGLRIEGSLPGEADPTVNPYAFTGASGQGGVGYGLGDAGQPGGQADGPAGVAEAASQVADANMQATGDSPQPSADGGATSQQPTQGTAGGSPGAAPQQGQAAVAAAASQLGDQTGSPGDSNRPPVPYKQDGVPMGRPIRLYVANDRVVVLPDRAQSPSAAELAASNPHNVEFPGKTSDQINDLIAALKSHADSWGIAGSGMYWDPRIQLNVTNDGVRRADEVRRLLQAAGLKVQAYPVATASQPGGARETR